MFSMFGSKTLCQPMQEKKTCEKCKSHLQQTLLHKEKESRERLGSKELEEPEE